MGRKNFIPSGEALGALLPLNVCWSFLNLHMHFGRGTEETETVIAAFAPDWLGHLGSSSAATLPSRKSQAKVQAAAPEIILEMKFQCQTGPSQFTTRRDSEHLQQRWLLLDVVSAFLI